MSTSREALEKAALYASSAENYYELLDNISEATDQELMDIIDLQSQENGHKPTDFNSIGTEIESAFTSTSAAHKTSIKR